MHDYIDQAVSMNLNISEAKNRFPDCVSMELEISGERNVNNIPSLAVKCLIHISCASIRIGKQRHLVRFGISRGQLRLNLKGCINESLPYVQFHQQHDRPKHIPANTELDRKLQSLITKLRVNIPEPMSISSGSFTDGNMADVPGEEIVLVSSISSATNPKWEFSSTVDTFLPISNYVYLQNLTHLSMTQNTAYLRATFHVPQDALCILDIPSLSKDINAEKKAALKALIRKQLWQEMFQPYICSQSILIAEP